MSRAGAMAVLAVIVLAGCASTVRPTASASSGAPAAESPAGPLELRGGELAPGTYTHSGFEPRLTFELGRGWQDVQNTSGFFDVLRVPAGPLGFPPSDACGCRSTT